MKNQSFKLISKQKLLLGFKPLAVVALVGVFFLFSGFKSLNRPDLSTPQKSFFQLVEALKSGDRVALEVIATETGIHSLKKMDDHPEIEGGISGLGKELESADISWDPITDDIYVARAQEGERVHKMEFTREEPGWMLYHWQVAVSAK